MRWWVMSDMTIGSLFSGIDGLALGLERAGLGHVVWQAETDPGASSVLAHHWPGVPNLGDVSKVDWAHVEPVDVLCGGFPCQPVSCAGKRKGRTDDRWLWPEVARAMDALRPAVVVVENVPGLLTVEDGAGFAEILGDLATLGYGAMWGLLGVWQVGGCHRRDRLFLAAFADQSVLPAYMAGPVLATHDGTTWSSVQTTLFEPASIQWPKAGVLRAGAVCMLGASPWIVRSVTGKRSGLLPTLLSHPTGRSAEAHLAMRTAMGRTSPTDLEAALLLFPTPTATNPNEAEDIDNWLARRKRQAERGINGNGMGIPLGVAVRLLPAPTAADSRGARNSTAGRLFWDGVHVGNTLSDIAYADRFGEYAAAVERWALVFGEEPPDPTETGPKGARRLSADFVRWMQGFDPGWCEGLRRASALKCFGNAVVPQVAQVIGEHVGAILGCNVAGMLGS